MPPDEPPELPGEPLDEPPELPEEPPDEPPELPDLPPDEVPDVPPDEPALPLPPDPLDESLPPDAGVDGAEELEEPLSDDDDSLGVVRLSVMYQPEPLNTIPGA